MERNRRTLLLVLGTSALLSGCSGGPSPNLDRIEACDGQAFAKGSTFLVSKSEAIPETYCFQLIDQHQCSYAKILEGGIHSPETRNVFCNATQESIQLELDGNVFTFKKNEKGNQPCVSSLHWIAESQTLSPTQMPCFDTQNNFRMMTALHGE